MSTITHQFHRKPVSKRARCPICHEVWYYLDTDNDHERQNTYKAEHARCWENLSSRLAQLNHRPSSGD